MRLGERVEEIDRQAKRLVLNDGATFGYDKLVIATGGRARPLPVPGAESGNILYLRTIADVEVLQPLMESGRRLVSRRRRLCRARSRGRRGETRSCRHRA